MKFEKISKDKIKVTLSKDDLLAKDIDLHSFMSNSDETQTLFLDVLDMAERDYGFSTENYNLKVETIALSDGCFVLTITRVLDKGKASPADNVPRRRVKATRKIPKGDDISCVIYKFITFDDFCGFAEYLSCAPLLNKKFAKDTILYKYNGNYYLVLSELDSGFSNFKSLFSAITEFGTYVSDSAIFFAKLKESAAVIFKYRAIQNCMKYFKDTAQK